MNNEKGNNDLERIIDSLTKRVKELEDINEAHQTVKCRVALRNTNVERHVI